MSEHPLLFSAEMVRAILEDRKTVTRRLSKNPNHYMGWKNGDKIWVRETFLTLMHKWDGDIFETSDCKVIESGSDAVRYGGKIALYRATETEFNPQTDGCDGDGFSALSCDVNRDELPKWRPSIHMPKWASRITLELTADVRREPLLIKGAAGYSFEDFEHEGFTSQSEFLRAWDSMNPKAPWNSNPTVSVIEFRRITP